MDSIARIFTTPGIGGGIVIFVLGTATLIYAGLTRWIIGGESRKA